MCSYAVFMGEEGDAGARGGEVRWRVLSLEKAVEEVNGDEGDAVCAKGGATRKRRGTGEKRTGERRLRDRGSGKLRKESGKRVKLSKLS